MNIIVVRGAGDIASGIIHRLSKCGFKVIALEVNEPLAIRRKVCFSEAIYEGEVEIDGVYCKYCENIDEAINVMQINKVALLKDPNCYCLDKVEPIVLIDAIIAKKNLGTKIDMAKYTIGLGPGFNAGVDVDVVIETMRGHDLGKIIKSGCAKENTGIPGTISGYGKERVGYSCDFGYIRNICDIGDILKENETICNIETADGAVLPIKSPMEGVLRGIIRDGQYVKKGLKILDIDPRKEEVKNCYTISDKARTISGSVLEVILSNNIFPK